MTIGWNELARYLAGSFALYLVLEGLLPFFNPLAAQRLMEKMAKADARHLRIGGLVSIAGGLALLWMVRNG